MHFLKPTRKHQTTIGCRASLCKTLGLSSLELEEIQKIPEVERYTKKEVVKNGGKKRVVHNPHHLIRKVQRKINSNIFKKLVTWPDYLYGSIPNTIVENTSGNGSPVVRKKDYVSCAANHCNAKSLLKMDIKDFFDNIHKDQVYKMYRRFFKFPEEVSSILTDLCCKGQTVVQGAPTSSYIASLILWDVEHQLFNKLSRKNLVYTRLVDDISISSKVSNYDFSMAESLVTQMLTYKELPVNKSKSTVSYLSTEPLSVHGIRVNYAEPRFPANEIRRLRAYVHNMKTLAKQPGYRKTREYRTDFAICMGRINKLKRVKHNKHTHFLEELRKIKPLPSEKDEKRCLEMVLRLEKMYPNEPSSFRYRKRFFRLYERLNVLQRLSKYRETVKSIRERMKKIRPTGHGI